MDRRSLFLFLLWVVKQKRREYAFQNWFLFKDDFIEHHPRTIAKYDFEFFSHDLDHMKSFSSSLKLNVTSSKLIRINFWMILTLIELLFFQWSCKWLHSSTKVGNNFPWQFLKLRSIQSRTSCVGFSLLFCSILVLILRAEPRSNYFSYISHHKKLENISNYNYLIRIQSFSSRI